MRERAHTTLPAATPATASGTGSTPSGHPGTSSQLALKDVTRTYGTRTVLDQVSFTVRPGGKVGVIGENGSGKSTLLRLLAGVEQPDGGEVRVRFPGGIGYLAQRLDLPATATVQDAVDQALADLRELERGLRAAEQRLASETVDEAELVAYGELLTAYEERGGYTADTRVDAALHGLGLPGLDRARPLGSLSGGEQSRLALACVLAAAPELLLLDEPTNHLDDQAVTWLQQHLAAYRGTVVVVTHDREFLAAVTAILLEVDRDTHAVLRHGDGLGGYRAAKAAARQRWAQRHDEWQAELARTLELVEAAGRRLAGTGKDPRQGFGKHRRSHEAKLGGQVRAARQRVHELRRNPVPAPPRPLRFDAVPDTAGAGAAGGAPALEVTDVVVPGRLDVPTLSLGAGQRLLVTGPNGAGKSTLLRVIAGDLAPAAGTVRRTARLGYLPQETGAAPGARQPLLAAFAAGLSGPPDEHADALLALGLFREEDLTVAVTALSVGQRRRLQLARLVTRPADLLVLDEPTNHLEPTLVDELEEALDAYQGTLVVVSHDRGYVREFRGERLELAGGRPAA
ncbi:ribosomal protection-like ABC-F family protein [Streptomyces sp. NPDC059009]|uniref:ribosomal protection-like ABC-F family protein n=1 Tax=Streptomyces sp. NPDC059009 TaxID=3346694 RepID=UPI0036935813